MAKSEKKVGASKATIADDHEDPYLPKLGKVVDFGKKPHCIYFYYVSAVDKKTNRRTIKHYYYTNGNKPIERDDLLEKINLLIENAKDASSYTKIPQYGSDWKGMVWTRRCYIVIFIDDPNVLFKRDKSGREVEALKFDENYGGMYNHSFFDAHQEYLGGCVTIWFVNHMKKRKQTGNAADLGTETQRFHFKLNTEPELTTEKGRRYPDSGGTNMGPAVPP